MSDARHRVVIVVALVALAGAVLGLTRFSRRGRTPAPTASAAAPAPRLEPLAADGWLVELEVPGFPSSPAAVPLGAAEPRPVVIALHGGDDRPEWACGTWTGISRSRAFVLCPRGKALTADRFGWGARDEVERELRAALKALKARFGRHVASGPVVLAAFGAGVRPALEIARSEPTFFNRLALVGAGPGLWSAGNAAVYARSGGQRVLWVVSDAASREASGKYWLFANGAGLETKLRDLGDRGVVFDAEVAQGTAAEWPWLVAGDPLHAEPGGSGPPR